MALAAGIMLGLIAMAAYGLGDAISKRPARAVGSVRTVFYRNLMVVAMLAVAVPFSMRGFHLQGAALAFAIGALAGYVPLASFFTAIERGKVGVIGPVANSSVLFTILLSATFFGESLAMLQSLAVISIIAGIALVSINFSHVRESSLLKLSGGVPFALLTAVLWGLFYFLIKIPTDSIGPVAAALFIELGIMVSALAHLTLSRQSLGMADRRPLRPIFVIAVLGMVGLVSFNAGLVVSQVSIIAALFGAHPLISALYGKVIYKERLRRLQYGALALIVAGIVALSAA